MPDEVRLGASLLLSLAAASLLTPIAIAAAHRTGSLDVPVGYKGHSTPTPYLGGMVLMAGFGLAALAFGGAASRFWPILVCALWLFAVGTVDDRIQMGPLPRVGAEVVAACALWTAGLGWSLFGGAADLLLTIVWVVGLVNAFNLMDNMDGAAGTVGAVAAAGAAALALAENDPVLAALAMAMVGASAGFLRYNLATPSRIFMGDGGSMPLGLVVAAAVMALPVGGDLGAFSLLAAAPVAGLPILDTILVVFSRLRRGAQVLSGHRDHLTHRLRARLGSARAVARLLGAAQGGLCLLALVEMQLGRGSVAALTAVCVAAGAATIWLLELPGLAVRARPAQQESSA